MKKFSFIICIAFILTIFFGCNTSSQAKNDINTLNVTVNAYATDVTYGEEGKNSILEGGIISNVYGNVIVEVIFKSETKEYKKTIFSEKKRLLVNGNYTERARKNLSYGVESLNIKLLNRDDIKSILYEMGYSDKEINEVDPMFYENISGKIENFRKMIRMSSIGTDLIKILEPTDSDYEEVEVNISLGHEYEMFHQVQPYETLPFYELDELVNNANGSYGLDDLLDSLRKEYRESIFSKDVFTGECVQSVTDDGLFVDRNTFTAVIINNFKKYNITLNFNFYITNESMGTTLEIFLDEYEFDLENGITYDIEVNGKTFTVTDKLSDYKQDDSFIGMSKYIEVNSTLKDTNYFFKDNETIRNIRLTINPKKPTSINFNIPQYVCNNPKSIIDDIEMEIGYVNKITKTKISQSGLAQLIMENITLEHGYVGDYKSKFTNDLLAANVNKKDYLCTFKANKDAEEAKYQYKINAQRYVNSIEVDLSNFKTDYYIGEDLVIEDLKAVITYYESGIDANNHENKKTEVCQLTSENITGFSSKEVGNIEIKVTIDGKVNTIKCLIKDNPLVSIALKPGSLSNTFIAFVKMDLSDSYLICTYESGLVKEVEITEEMITGFEDKAGTQEITIKYDSQEIKTNIDVYEVKKISIYEDTKLYYVIGESDPEVYLKCTFTNGDYDIFKVDDSELTSFDSSTNGTRRINITYANIDITYTYTILSDVYIKYVINENSVKISGFTIEKPTDYYFKLENAKEVIIPETINDLPVTSINANAFDGASFITKVVLPQTITTIGAYAFRNCSSLESINIPTNASTVGKDILKGDVKLRKLETNGSIKLYTLINQTEIKNLEIIINNDVDSLIDDFIDGNIVFEIKKLTFGQSLQTLGEQNYLRKIKEFESASETIKVIENVIYTDSEKVLQYYSENKTDKEFICPNTVTNIVFFKDNEYIEKITIPQSVKTLGKFFLSSCTKLSTVIFEGEIEVLPSGMLVRAKSLEKFDFPKGVKVIDSILSYSAVKDIKIPDTVEELSYSAFYGSNVERMYIPKSVTPLLKSSYYFSLPCLKSIAYDGSVRIRSSLFFDTFSQKNTFPNFDTVYITGESELDCTLYQTYTITNLYVDKKVTYMDNYVINYGSTEGLNVYCEGKPIGFSEYKSCTFNYNYTYDKWWE